MGMQIATVIAVGVLWVLCYVAGFNHGWVKGVDAALDTFEALGWMKKEAGHD